MPEETRKPQWLQPKPAPGGLPPVMTQNGSEERCSNCGSSMPPGVRFCPACGAMAEPPPRRRRSRLAIYAAVLVAILGIGIGAWRLIDSNRSAKAHGGPVANHKPPPHKKNAAPVGNKHRAEIARIGQLVRLYGRTRSRTKTCSLETTRKKTYQFGNPALCPLRIGMYIVHYHVLGVKVHGARAKVEVTGELGRETLWLVRSPSQGWQVDGLYRHRHPGGSRSRNRIA